MTTGFTRGRVAAVQFGIVALLALGACGSGSGDPHAGHGHDDHDDHSDHDDHGAEVVRLSQAQLDEAGVIIEPLGGGVIATHVTLPAEVRLNQDTVLHVTPRAPGIVSEVRGFLGDHVESGALLAVLESPGLGEAKIAYLQAAQAKAVADSELARQRTISENTSTLLELLRAEPELDTLRNAASDLRIGANKGRLISAYARRKAAYTNYARERELRAKNLSTEVDLLSAQEAYNSSQADYLALFEDIDFRYRLDLQEAERDAGVASSSVENAGRRLHLLGLSDDQIETIAEEPADRFARYELRSPIGGRIVAKHITPGEMIDDEEAVYTIADLDTVWLNIAVYTEYAGLIREGQPVVIHAGSRRASGVVDYVSAVVSEETRTVSARVVVANKDRAWKPGEFVTALVETGEAPAMRVVPSEAVQTYEGRTVVFVQGPDGIEPRRVELGRSNGRLVELLGEDIPLGAPVVVANSFLMKAELGKGAAGHDH